MPKSTPFNGSFNPILWELPRPKTESPIPNNVISMPARVWSDKCSPNIIHPKKAAAMGAVVINNCPNREPISTYEVKRQESPNTYPTKPDKANQINVAESV